MQLKTEVDIKAITKRPTDFMVGCGASLWLRVRTTGRKTFIVRRKEIKKTKIITLGDWPTLSLKNAKLMAENLKNSTVPVSLQIAFLQQESLLNIQNLTEIPLHKHGIYFLIENSEVIYIGQSINPLSRIGEHLRSKSGKFDRVFFIPVPWSILNTMENHFIKLLSPKLNGNNGPQQKYEFE